MSCFRTKAAKQQSAIRSTSIKPPDYSTSQWLEHEKIWQPLSGPTKAESSNTFVVQEVVPVHVEDVWREVRALERRHFASSRYRRIGRTMEPVIDFFTRFSPVLDSMVQYGTSSATIVWGSLKAVLVV